jgi:hypothetical protein
VRVVLIGVVFALALGHAMPASAARLTAADRQQISASIDAFVNHAVKRRDVGAAYGVVDSQLRAGMSRTEWAKGDIGVYPYPARGLHHPWTLDYIEGNEVGAELMLQPPLSNSRVGPIMFKIYVDRVGDRWLIDSFMPVATFAPLNAHKTKVRALNDFSPRSGGDSSAPTGRGRISSAYLVIPFGLLGAAVLGALGWGLTRAIRSRPRREALPPLSIRADDARARTGNRP